jgi:hypothetical protein
LIICFFIPLVTEVVLHLSVLILGSTNTRTELVETR